MRKWSSRGYFIAVLAIAFVGGLLNTGIVFAFQSQSSNYAVDEAFFGTGGELESASANYKAKLAAGEMTVGSSQSTNYQMQAGFNTSDIPLLEFAVDGGAFDMGIIHAENTGMATTGFRVRNYLSSGYVVRITGASLTTTNGNLHTITPNASATVSTQGQEQFGVNVVDNSDPDIGANPVQVPDSSFSFGTQVSGYDTPNYFKFVDNDVIALSDKSSGQTNYTLSMVANVSMLTPAGHYTGHLVLQVIPTF